MEIKATTILAVRKDGHTVIVADGQATQGEIMIKGHVKKLHRIYNDKVIVGFAGSASDGIQLYTKLEEYLQKFSGNLMRSAVELSINIRETNRKLEAVLIVADKDHMYMVSGSSDVLEPDDGILATGSGGYYALSAARALMKYTDMSAREIAEKSIDIAADLCIYTNHNFTFEEV